jgi:cyclase
LIKRITSKIDLPIVAHGGVGNSQDVFNAFEVGADAVALASVLHYEAVVNNKVNKEVDGTEGNTRFLKESTRFSKIKPISLVDLKKDLVKLCADIRK